MGELFVNVNEYLPLVKERLIDFIRVHMSDIGGRVSLHVVFSRCSVALCSDLKKSMTINIKTS